MKNLINIIKNTKDQKTDLPFSIYTSIHEQKLLNVPIAKPLLIVVLNGVKELGAINKITCHAGEFIFLSNSHSINMRNIPKNNEYYALLIEFEYQDFEGLERNSSNKNEHYIGEVCEKIEQCLTSFVESCLWAPSELSTLRKREIISLLSHLGHKDVLSLLFNPQLKDQIHDLLINHQHFDFNMDNICKKLAMSESTVRRKLKDESTSVQEIKDNSRMGLALHLLQSSTYSIGLISEKCGYQSQSRFTQRFKNHFGLTPTELRNTKLT